MKLCHIRFEAIFMAYICAVFHIHSYVVKLLFSHYMKRQKEDPRPNVIFLRSSGKSKQATVLSVLISCLVLIDCYLYAT
jgi:hypothetical protein